MSKAIPIPLGWKVIIQPKRGATETAGGIDISAGAEAEEHLNYVGQIIAMGEAAFCAATKAGIDMGGWKARPVVGDYVLYTPYAGMRIRRAGESEEKYILLCNDTDIQAIIDSPDEYYSWVDAR